MLEKEYRSGSYRSTVELVEQTSLAIESRIDKAATRAWGGRASWRAYRRIGVGSAGASPSPCCGFICTFFNRMLVALLCLVTLYAGCAHEPTEKDMIKMGKASQLAELYRQRAITEPGSQAARDLAWSIYLAENDYLKEFDESPHEIRGPEGNLQPLRLPTEEQKSAWLRYRAVENEEAMILYGKPDELAVSRDELAKDRALFQQAVETALRQDSSFAEKVRLLKQERLKKLQALSKPQARETVQSRARELSAWWNALPY